HFATPPAAHARAGASAANARRAGSQRISYIYLPSRNRAKKRATRRKRRFRRRIFLLPSFPSCDLSQNRLIAIFTMSWIDSFGSFAEAFQAFASPVVKNVIGVPPRDWVELRPPKSGPCGVLLSPTM